MCGNCEYRHASGVNCRYRLGRAPARVWMLIITIFTLAGAFAQEPAPPMPAIDFSTFTPKTVARIFDGMRNALAEAHRQQSIIVQANVELGKRAADAEEQANIAIAAAAMAEKEGETLQGTIIGLRQEVLELEAKMAALRRFCHAVLIAIFVTVTAFVWSVLQKFDVGRIPLIGGWLSGYAAIARVIIAIAAGSAAATTAWVILSRI
jgi:hypothetical protein